MSESTKIQWCDSTVNFWSGCTKVSPGCAHCYAEAQSKRFFTFGKWGKGAPRQLHEPAFKLAEKLNAKPWVCDHCGHAIGGQPAWCPSCSCESLHRRRVFSLSIGDWLDSEVPIEWLERMLDTVRRCDQVEWILCTKRPELWREQLEKVDASQPLAATWLNGNPPVHVTLLASVENQEQANKRIPELLKIPASRRGLSCEPLLGPVNLSKWLNGSDGTARTDGNGLDWVIVGGESGPGARPCNVGWISALILQCLAHGTPCFVKQLGSNVIVATGYDIPTKHRNGGDPDEWPEFLRVQQWPAQW